MNKQERVDVLLDLSNAMKGIENTEDAAFYLYAKDEYDVFYAGDMETLCYTFINAMKDDEDLRQVISEAVRVVDEEDVDLSLN